MMTKEESTKNFQFHDLWGKSHLVKMHYFFENLLLYSQA